MDTMAFYAVLIALLVSLGEMLSKYETKIFSDIFNRYLALYLAINGTFAFLAYLFLPEAAGFFLPDNEQQWTREPSWGRVFVAAFGYMVLVRTKVFTIKDVPIGPDVLYNTFANYCLRHTNMLIQNRQDADLQAVYSLFNKLETYQAALDDRLESAPPGERETIRLQRDQITTSTGLTDHVKCKRLGELILRIVGSKKELETALKNVTPPP